MAVVVIDTIKPKNQGTFPIVEAADVKVTDSKRLDVALNDKANQSDVTALQTAVAGKASQSDLNALSSVVSGKQNALTTEQLAATNSGITSELVTQIGTNTTAIASKADASDVATETASLQAQIDNIVTPVTQDAEVQNARIGADGTSYNTLKSRIDTEYTYHNNEIANIRSGITELETLDLEQGGISFSTGEPTEATNRCRTKNSLSVTQMHEEGAVVISSGSCLIMSRIYTIGGVYIAGADETTDVDFYFITNPTNYQSWDNLSAEDKQLIQSGNVVAKFVIKKTDDADITPNDVSIKSNNIKIKEEITNARTNASGITFATLKQRLDAEAVPSFKTFLSLEQGSISFYTGAPTEVTNRCRTEESLSVTQMYEEGAVVTPSDNCLLMSRIYTTSGTYIAGADETTDVDFYFITNPTNYANWDNLSPEDKQLIQSGNVVAKFIIKRTDDADITPSDVSINYNFKKYGTSYINVTKVSDFAQVNNGIAICRKGTYHVSSTIDIDIASIKKIDGNGATFIVDSNITAFNVHGSLNVSSASPITIPSSVYNEMGTSIENLTITSSTGAEGTGIIVSQCMGLVIRNCTVRNMENGIVIAGINRNLIFEGNFIYACAENGLKYDNTCNLHQCNIYGNHISYCKTCLNIDNSVQIANFQITGNDIEIGDYPVSTKANAKCINITANASTVFFGEIVITGNTVQGHSYSDCVIFISGYSSSKTINNISINGNHISNDNVLYKLSNLKGVSISGNNYKEVGGYVVELNNNISYMSISADTGFGITSGFIHALSTAIINGLVSVGCCLDVPTNNIETTNTTNVDI